MSSVCISAVGCVDARVPVRATYVNLYKWPESDAEFVKAVTTGRGNINTHNRRKWSPSSPTVVDSYSCRQMYLRSYTFSKKESVPQKTRRCLGKVKERAVLFGKKKSSSDDTTTSSSSSSSRRHMNSSRRKKKKKGCVTVRKLREVSCSALYAIFHRLLSCTTSVDVVDHSPTS